MTHGYKITLISGYEFSKIDMFSEYVNEFYKLKKNAKTAAEKLIAKMHLNQIYGYFGRRLELIETINVRNVDIREILTRKIVKSIIRINDTHSTLLVINNIDLDILTKLKEGLPELIISKKEGNNYPVKSNVAIAAAVTAFNAARIHMIKYKLSDDIFYTDTDSIFTSTILNESEIGKELGLMKDELNGKIINKAIFLGIKRYGYYYYDNNNKIEKSVFAGVERDSLKFSEIEDIFNGSSITKKIDVRFYKSFNDLNITIKSSKITIKKNNEKILVDNNYIPIKICKTNHNLDNRTIYEKFKNKMIKLFKCFLKKLNLKLFY
jgi:hypothetical protein